MYRASTNATMAKIRAIHGRMLTGEDYRILSAKQSVSEAAQYLKSHVRFREIMSDIDVNTVHRGYIEELLKKNNFEMFVRLRDFQHLKNAQFYNSTCEKYEIEQLLSLITAISGAEKHSFVRSLPVYFFPQTDLDFLELSKCRSLKELSRLLENTKYAPLAASIKRNSEGELDFFGIETDFTAFYYKRLMHSIYEDLPKADAKLLREAVRRDIYLRNFVSAYRMKVYFGIGENEIRARLQPLIKAGRSHMDRLYECSSESEMLRLIGKLSGSGEKPVQEGEFIETAMARASLRYARKLMRTQSMPAVYYAFLQLCDIEVSNIIHIIEGIRYGLKPDKIEQLIAY